MAKKKKVNLDNWPASPPPEPPHHWFNYYETREFTCVRCGYVLGSGGGKMPVCYRASTEERQKNITTGKQTIKEIRK